MAPRKDATCPIIDLAKDGRGTVEMGSGDVMCVAGADPITESADLEEIKKSHMDIVIPLLTICSRHCQHFIPEKFLFFRTGAGKCGLNPKKTKEIVVHSAQYEADGFGPHIITVVGAAINNNVQLAEEEIRKRVDGSE